LPTGTPPSVAHVAFPVPDVVGPAQFIAHEPQLAGAVGSTQ
jgi:hypothetical protein